jgi:hypothetical protein
MAKFRAFAPPRGVESAEHARVPPMHDLMMSGRGDRQDFHMTPSRLGKKRAVRGARRSRRA